MKACTSCNSLIGKKFVEFKCPKCKKHTIIRCDHCRATSKEYICPDCGFEGP